MGRLKKNFSWNFLITTGVFTITILGYKQGQFFPNKMRDSRFQHIKIPRDNYIDNIDNHMDDHFKRYQRTQNIPEFIYKRILKKSSISAFPAPEFIYKRIL